MKVYNTLSEALTDLDKRGYTHDFNLTEDCIECKADHQKISPEKFEIVEFYRFEGMTSTDDESVVYVIETQDGLKGTLVDAYGVYSDSLSPKMIDKLKFAQG
ncbi:MAG: phosphoribosylpyrophosphate synthetase [Crocinitomicaceae bacterium]|nr:phosphoribosylpyrophosphate synthetase [Crocinitomicaceae bacterium]|tara:strand:+ start:116 stop:421 length:306 start_codon:yes stop_codon:yes gene_type:complete